jgi:hypothetical protein
VRKGQGAAVVIPSGSNWASLQDWVPIVGSGCSFTLHFDDGTLTGRTPTVAVLVR